MAGPSRDLGPHAEAARAWLRSHGGHSLIDALLFLLQASRADGVDELSVSHATTLGFVADEYSFPPEDSLEGPLALMASALGLAGATSPLPLYLVEEAATDDEAATVIRGILDVIHERLYIGLATGLAALEADAEPVAALSAWTKRVLALAGSDVALQLAPEVALQLVPLVVSGDRSRHAIETAARVVLQPYVGDATLRLSGMAGDFTPLLEEQTTRLGTSTAVLGETFIAGSTIFSPAASAKLVIGPIPQELEAEFAPDANGYRAIEALRELFIPASLHLQISLLVAGGAARLGRSSLGADFFLVDDHGAISSAVTARPIELS